MGYGPLVRPLEDTAIGCRSSAGLVQDSTVGSRPSARLFGSLVHGWISHILSVFDCFSKHDKIIYKLYVLF